MDVEVESVCVKLLSIKSCMIILQAIWFWRYTSHLQKCMEGIYKILFEGTEDIVTMERLKENPVYYGVYSSLKELKKDMVNKVA